MFVFCSDAILIHLLVFQMATLLEGYRFGSRTGTSVLLKLDQVPIRYSKQYLSCTSDCMSRFPPGSPKRKKAGYDWVTFLTF